MNGRILSKHLLGWGYFLIGTANLTGETLYNGVELPRVWPPTSLDPASTAPMPVPWLKNSPKLIPIDVGRQLFVDDFLLASSDGVQRIFHQPEKYISNPVFSAETEAEKSANDVVYLGQGGVFWDPREKHFKMYYTAGWRGPLALATSQDLVTWQRPEGQSAGGNLVLPAGIKWSGSEARVSGSDNAIWLDLDASEADLDTRIKFLTCWMHGPGAKKNLEFTHSLQVGDGRQWTDAVPCLGGGKTSDYGSIFYNPFRGKWVQSIKKNGPRGRCRYYVESDEFLAGADWSSAVYWTNADELDRAEPTGGYPYAGNEPQIYNLTAVAYESVMIGMHQILRGPHNSVCEEGGFPKLTDLEIGFSRDGFHWHRPDRRGFIRGDRMAGSWERGYVHGTTGVFVVLEEQLVFPYCAYSGVKADGARDMYAGASIGLASLRRDGFASMQAGASEGELVTKPLLFAGRHLFVNGNFADGELSVEVLDSQGRVIEPFSRDNCEVFTANSTATEVKWKGGMDLAGLSGKPVTLKFYLRQGDLYSFWVSPDAAGHSYGYVGAGGPDYPGSRDVPGEQGDN